MGQRHIGDRRQALVPEMGGAFAGGAEPADLAEGRTHAHELGPLRVRPTARTMTHTTTVRRDRADDVGESDLVAGSLLHAARCIPEEMAQAAEEVEHQRPGESEQHQIADDGSEQAGDEIVVGGPAGDGNKPPGHKKHAEIKRCAGDPLQDRRDHRQDRLVNLEMRR